VIRFRSASCSTRGLHNETNGDSLLDDLAAGVFVVADGVGGASEPDVASRIAVASVRSQFASGARNGTVESALATLENTFNAANESILLRRTRTRLAIQTTMTAGVILDSTLCLAHSGDSRAYLVNASEISLLTTDDTVVAELAREGRMSSDRARCHPRRNILSGCLGLHAHLKIQTGVHRLVGGDMIVLCTDGVWGVLQDREIAECVRGSPDLDDAIGRLQREVRHRGGTDDATAIAVRAEEI